MIVIYWNVNAIETENKMIVYRGYKRMDVEEFLKLVDISISSIIITKDSDINILADSAIDKIIKCLNAVAPNRRIKL